MSAIGTKQTSPNARTCPLLGEKRTCSFALQMSAYDPKRTSPNRHNAARLTLCDVMN